MEGAALGQGADASEGEDMASILAAPEAPLPYSQLAPAPLALGLRDGKHARSWEGWAEGAAGALVGGIGGALVAFWATGVIVSRCADALACRK